MPTGELPRNVQLVVDRNLVGRVAPGTRVTAYGIYSIYQARSLKHEDLDVVEADMKKSLDLPFRAANSKFVGAMLSH